MIIIKTNIMILIRGLPKNKKMKEENCIISVNLIKIII